MTENSPTNFKSIREVALKAWILGTGRDARKPSDIEGSWECRWQNRAIDECGFNHISFFCSSAAWACSITDVLRLKTYDTIQFNHKTKNKLLFRHYVRLLLVVSEVLDDLVAIRMVGSSISKQDAREELSKVGANSIHELFNFINNCCKHKFKGYHVCNFDLPIAFVDDPDFKAQQGDISVASLDFASATRIVMPKLKDIVSVTTHAYKMLDLHYQDESLFRKSCERFDRK
jgi:hypothetical protein